MRDLRGTSAYAEVDAFLHQWLDPAVGTVSDAAELAPHPDGRRVAFTGAWWERIEGRAGSRIVVADLESGELSVVSAGPYNDRSPAWSPDGATLAFLSDAAERGVHQLWVTSRAAAPVD